MKNFFKERQKKKTLAQNKINGKAAERYFAGLLTTALDARVFWATRTEDDSKVDLISIISHPFLENRVEVIFTQVKSGPSFCAIQEKSLRVVKEKFSNLLKRNHHTLVCWSLIDKETPYWFFIKANSTYFRSSYSESHIISPASRFDIIRILNSSALKDGGKGLIFSRQNKYHEYVREDLRQLRTKAKIIYTSLKSTEVYNQLFGNIEFTRLGWRHMTRESRLNTFKTASYEIIPILGRIIERNPTKHYTREAKHYSDKESEYRISEYLLEYDNVKCYDRNESSCINTIVYVKLLEIVGYKSNWKEVLNSSSQTERRVIFKSVYYKEK